MLAVVFKQSHSLLYVTFVAITCKNHVCTMYIQCIVIIMILEVYFSKYEYVIT